MSKYMLGFVFSQLIVSKYRSQICSRMFKGHTAVTSAGTWCLVCVSYTCTVVPAI